MNDAAAAPRPDIVFEDFEKADYAGWTVEGEAFGTKPAGGGYGSRSRIRAPAFQITSGTESSNPSTRPRPTAQESGWQRRSKP